MDIFPGQRKVAPLQPPVESLAVRGFKQGLEDADKLPTATTAVAQAITGGLSAYNTETQALQQQRQNEANIGFTEARTQAESVEAALAPLKIQTESIRARAEMIRAGAEATKDDALAKSALLQHQTDALKFKAKSDTADLLTQISGAQSADEYSSLLSKIENNPRTVADAIADYSGKDETGSKIQLDLGLQAMLKRLPAIAERFQNQELTSRTNKVLGNLESIVNNSSRAAKGESISFGANTEQAPADPTAEFLRSQGVDVSAAGSSAPVQEPTAAPVKPATTDETVKALRNIDATQPAQAASPQGDTAPTEYSRPNIRFPQSVGDQPKYVQGIDEWADDAEKDVPFAKRVLKHLPPGEQEEVMKIRENLIADGADPKTAGTQAVAIYKSNQLDANQQKYVSDLSQSASKFREAAKRGQAALTRLQKLEQENPDIIAALGPSHTWEKALNWLRAKQGDPKAREYADQIKADLDAVSAQGLFDTAHEYGFGTQAYNTPAEQELIRSIAVPKDATIERYISAMQLLGSKAEEAHQMGEVIKLARRKKMSFEDAKAIADEYRDANPSTTEADINGQTYLAHNQHKQDVYRWMDDRFGFSKYISRDKDGRAITSSPANIPDIIQKGSNLDLNTIPDGKDVPARQAEVNDATILRQIAAESGGDPYAVSYDKDGNVVAEGIAQFTRATGKKLWKELNFPGPYNPFNQEKSIIMAHTLMNRNLVAAKGDTRLALAMYNAGEGNVKDAIFKAIKSARDTFGNTDWDTVKHYLPKPEETIPYVEKIMGDRPGLGGLRKTTPQEIKTVLASLPTQKAQNNARALLSDEGMNALADTQGITTIDQTKGTVLEKGINMLLSANPFAATEAKAEEVDPNAGSVENISMQTGTEPGAGNTEQPDVPEPPSLTPDQKQFKEALGGVKPWMKETFKNAEKPKVEGKPVKDLTEGLQAFSVGATRGLMFGAEDEVFALARMGIHGEDWDTAVAHTRAIRDHLQEQNPGFYTTGQIYGSIESGRAAAKVLPGFFTGPENPTALQTVKTGARVGAVIGGATGAAEGEGGVNNRAASAVRGAVSGGVFGAAIGGIIAAGTKIAESDPFKNFFATAFGKATGQPIPQKLSKAEKEVTKTLGVDAEKAVEKAGTVIKESDNPAVSLIDELPEVHKEALIEQASKDPRAAEELQKIATERNQSHDTRLAGILGKYGDVADPEEAATAVSRTAGSRAEVLEQKTAGEAEKVFAGQASRVSKELDQYTPKANPIEANKKAANVLQSRLDTYVNERRALAEGDYKAAANTLAKTPNRAGNKELPSFVSSEVKQVLNDKTVRAKVNSVRQSIPELTDHPANSLEVLQVAKTQLYNESQGGGKEANLAGEAFKKLQGAMHGESEAYAAADAAYQEGSEAIRQFNTKLVQQGIKYDESGNVVDYRKFSKTFMSADEDTLRRFMGSLEPEEQQAFKQVARGYIEDQIAARGARTKGTAQVFPDFTKNHTPEKLKAIFGDEEGERLTASLLSEREAATAARAKFKEKVVPKSLQTLRKRASSTQSADVTKVGDDLFRMDNKNLTSFINESSEDELNSVRNAALAHIQRSGVSKDLPADKIKLIFGEGVGNELIQDIEQERRILATNDLILRKAHSTAAATTQELQRYKEQIAPALEKAVAITAASFTPGIQASGFGPVGQLAGLYQGIRGFHAALRAGKLSSEIKLSEEIGKILTLDEQAGTQFVGRIANQLKAEGQNDVLRLWNKVVASARQNMGSITKRAAQVGGEYIGSYGEDFKPQTQQRRREESSMKPSREYTVNQ